MEDDDLRDLYDWVRNYNSIVGLYHNETDRAAAVLAGSVLDTYFGRALKAFFVDDSSVDELFTGYAPLSSFSGRISIAYAVGLINRTMRDDSNYVRKIRNHFAHHPAETSFNMSPVRDLCANLSTAKPMAMEDGSTFHQTDPRSQYLLVIAMTVVSLHKIMRAQQRRVIPAHGS